MPTRIVFAASLVAALVAQPALAEQWISISKTADDHPVETFIDMSSIAIADGIRVAQTKTVLLVPWPDNVQPNERVFFSLQRMSFDCNAGLVKHGSSEVHYSDGRLGFIDFTQSWQPIEDPRTKKMFDVVCAAGESKPS